MWGVRNINVVSSNKGWWSGRNWLRRKKKHQKTIEWFPPKL